MLRCWLVWWVPIGFGWLVRTGRSSFTSPVNPGLILWGYAQPRPLPRLRGGGGGPCLPVQQLEMAFPERGDDGPDRGRHRLASSASPRQSDRRRGRDVRLLGPPGSG